MAYPLNGVQNTKHFSDVTSFRSMQEICLIDTLKPHQELCNHALPSISIFHSNTVKCPSSNLQKLLYLLVLGATVVLAVAEVLGLAAGAAAGLGAGAEEMELK